MSMGSWVAYVYAHSSHEGQIVILWAAPTLSINPKNYTPRTQH